MTAFIIRYYIQSSSVVNNYPVTVDVFGAFAAGRFGGGSVESSFSAEELDTG
jgi:hypothetical protein